jgi:excisionase family DNA binding protein
LYRIEDAALTTGLSRSKIYELISDGELQTVHFGRAVRITADSLHALIQRRTDPVKQSPAPSETRVLLDRAVARRASGKPRKSTAQHAKDAAPQTPQL